MKNIIKYIALLLFALIVTLSVSAQEVSPPHPDQNGDGSSVGGGVVGGGAPIDGGLTLLLALGAAYGGKKIYNMTRR